MRVVIQRVSKASVRFDNKEVGQISHGLLLFLGIEDADEQNDIHWLVRKIINMRIFSDEAGKMNKSLVDIDGSILLISQFTLHASTKKGNRPSFIKAAKPDYADKLYQDFAIEIRKHNISVETGVFGAFMEIELINDGPVTILLDSRNKE
jgi:D-tyrosyl-tRNA(Tyr) deacylase